ncbi:MAG: excinuclease ABC subunit UvrC [Rothia sp. (in: high G+C Gram-positive bacteria)]|nr:excinuclease ABC subunit UvrC [Rothia sp. (in: high G+C Gram-positive bacteria)]
MADPASYRPAPGQIPTGPGVYRFRDESGRIIYVGKAKNLRNRLNSYFAAPDRLSPKTFAMVHTAVSVEWTLVATELESLQLEYTWIKEYKPRFNIAFRDDKTYPYLALTLNEPIPRAMIMRGEKKKGVRYFGPFTHVWAIREGLDALLRVFPVRTCSSGVLKKAQASGKPCLLADIEKCSAPCVGRISEEDHRQLLAGLSSFMSGGSPAYLADLNRQMEQAAEELDFERAARVRDDLLALRKVFEPNTVVLADSVHADIFNLAEDELELSLQVFSVRSGQIRSQLGWVLEKVDDLSPEALMEKLLIQVYGQSSVALATAQSPEERAHHLHEIPAQVNLPYLPENREQLEAWLSGMRGGPVSLSVPQRGDRVELMKTVGQNAQQALKLHKLKRAGDISNRSASLTELQEALDIAEPLMRIECYDVSHLQGEQVVASMVVFEDGLPAKKAYRSFSISGPAARDDTASIYDVISRRFKRYLAEEAPSADRWVSGQVPAQRQGRPVFSTRPQLVLIDGGQPQVAAASRALEDLGIEDIFIAGIAKRLEEIWLPGEDFPLILPRSSQGLYLVQRLRDEAHRFAISLHRRKRSKEMLVSSLDSIEGLGPGRRQALIERFGSFAQIQAASEEDLRSVPGIGPALAAKIKQEVR